MLEPRFIFWYDTKPHKPVRRQAIIWTNAVLLLIGLQALQCLKQGIIIYIEKNEFENPWY